MDEVKRLNYFTSQFLEEGDFKDEQAYHRNLRRLHNQSLHTWGVASGLMLNQVSGNPKQLAITPGVAIDNQGREIVLPDNPPPGNIDLASVSAAVPSVTVAISYQEFPTSPYRDTTNFRRVTERPKIIIYDSGVSQTDSEGQRWEFTTISAPTDGSVIVLGRVTLQSGNVVSIDTSVRRLASAIIAADAIDSSKIAPGAITTDRIANNAVGTAQLAAGAVTNDRLAAAVQQQISAPILSINNLTTDATSRNISLTGTNAINITAPAGGKTITIGETHSGETTNPHQTTATQIDTQGGTNRIVARINAGTGVISDARIDTTIARAAAVNARFDPATGHSHDGADSRRIAPTNLAGVNPTVTAANLNTLTTGATSDASSLHVHSTIPTQTGIYHIPMAPLRITPTTGTPQEFEANLTTITARTGVAALGRIPLLFPNRIQTTRLVIVTSVSVAGTTFQLSVQIQLVPSNGNSISSITPPISITSAGVTERPVSHSVDLSSGFYWLVLTMQTPASGGNLLINQLFIDYTFNRLF